MTNKKRTADKAGPHNVKASPVKTVKRNKKGKKGSNEPHVKRPVNQFILAQCFFFYFLFNTIIPEDRRPGYGYLCQMRPWVSGRLLELIVIWKQQHGAGNAERDTTKFGKFWKEVFTQDDKKDWEALAAWEGAKHKERHPDYKYEPGSGRETKDYEGAIEVKTSVPTQEFGVSEYRHKEPQPPEPRRFSEAGPSNMLLPMLAPRTKRTREDDEFVSTRQAATKRARQSALQYPPKRHMQLPVAPVLPSTSCPASSAPTSLPFTPDNAFAHTGKSPIAHLPQATSTHVPRTLAHQPDRRVWNPDGAHGTSPSVQSTTSTQGSPYSRNTYMRALRDEGSSLDASLFSSFEAKNYSVTLETDTQSRSQLLPWLTSSALGLEANGASTPAATVDFTGIVTPAPDRAFADNALAFEYNTGYSTPQSMNTSLNAFPAENYFHLSDNAALPKLGLDYISEDCSHNLSVDPPYGGSYAADYSSVSATGSTVEFANSPLSDVQHVEGLVAHGHTVDHLQAHSGTAVDNVHHNAYQFAQGTWTSAINDPQYALGTTLAPPQATCTDNQTPPEPVAQIIFNLEAFAD